MTEFLNYKVVLDLKDSSLILGVISHVDGTSITLGSKTINNSLVKDLKVVQLPPDQKLNKKKQAIQLEDAAVSATGSRSSTPRLPKQPVLSGWTASSEIEEIKTSDDFDFAANLAMFDKKSVFADFQKNDTVNSQDRLVGHNKAPAKQGASEKKDKYENDEMVIPKNKQDNWNNIGSVSDRLALPVPSGGAGNQSALGKPSREIQLYKFIFEATGAPVPMATPVQLFEIEREAHVSSGLDSKVLVEVCASNLFRLVVDNMLGGSVRLSNKKNHNLPPLVLLLIGHSRSSSRAFALGRHLTNHGVRVLAFVGSESLETELLAQCQLFEQCGGKVVSADFGDLLDILHNQLETPVEVIVDSLQGFDGLLADMCESEASVASLKQLVAWVNEPKQKSKVISFDIPSGIDGGSGTVQDSLLHIHCKLVVSLGLPITGLVHAYNNGTIHADEVQHFVVDSGIPNSLYQLRPHLRKFDKFWFCAEQYLRLLLVSEAQKK